MTPPPSSSTADPIQPGAVAVACPSCFGAIAVTADLQGRPAECPLCGGGFRAPMPPAASRPDATAPTPADRSSVTAPPRGAGSPTAAPDALAIPEPPPGAAAPVIAGMEFRESVRTIGSGDRVIELRRLTPEEKAARRARRNLVMMLVGLAILLAIVQVFGTSRR